MIVLKLTVVSWACTGNMWTCVYMHRPFVAISIRVYTLHLCLFSRLSSLLECRTHIAACPLLPLTLSLILSLLSCLLQEGTEKLFQQTLRVQVCLTHNRKPYPFMSPDLVLHLSRHRWADSSVLCCALHHLPHSFMFPHQVRSSSAHSATAEEVRQRRDLTTTLHQPPVQPAQPPEPEPEPEPSAPPSHKAALSYPTAIPHFQSSACSERPGVYSHPDTSAA